MMRVLVAIVAMTLSLAAMPAEAADYGPQAPDTRFLIRELDSAPEASGDRNQYRVTMPKLPPPPPVCAHQRS